ncbi:MAG: hypothetical protein ACREFD_09165 [Stellaceae bacterium]
MAKARERQWLRWLIAYSGFAIALAALTTFAYASAADAHKALVVRIAVATLVGIVLVHIGTRLWGRIDRMPPSAFEGANHPSPAPPAIDPLLVKLQVEIENGHMSRHYFDRVLWPRLERLRGAALIRPPQPRWHRRGPSLAALAALLSEIERQS